MMLRYKTSLLIGAALAVLLIVVYTASQLILVKGYLQLEQQDTHKNLQRALDALSDDLSALNSQLGDWAAWDESYAFVRDANPDFIKRNLPDATYVDLKLNLLAFIDPQGRLVFGNAFDLQNKTSGPVDPELSTYLTQHLQLWRHPNTESSVTGLIALSTGTMLIAARPVLTTQREGPIRGSMIMGRYLSADEVERLARVTHLALTLHPYNTALSAPLEKVRSYLLSHQPTFINRLGPTSIAGYALLRDIDNKPALIVQVVNPRTIYQQGQTTLRYFILWLLFIGVLAGLLVQGLIGKLLRTRAEQRQTEERYHAVVEQTNYGIFLADAASKRLLEANSAFCELWEYNAQAINALTLYDVLAAAHAEVDDIVQQVLHERHCLIGERKHYRKDGSSIDVEITANLITHAGKQTLCVIVQDISQRKQAEDRIRHLVHYDPLTQLPNRILLEDRLRQNLAHAQRGKGMVALLLIDLDRFKVINDTLGHPIGDRLLQWAAQRLSACVRAEDTVSRQGGDEFIVMMSEINRLEDVAYLAQKLLTALAAPCEIPGHRLTVSASIGISLYPDDGMDADTLIKCADIAMYHAKDKGGANYQFFTAELNARASTRMTLENSLRSALQREEFFLVYQPVVDLHSGLIIGAEALLRWRHPQRGLIPPAEFIPIAEETGLIISIGNWVLRNACRQAQAWHAQGFNHLRLAVNLSTRQFNQQDLITLIAAALSRSGLPAQCLELEITESLLIENVDNTLATMHELTALGVGLSIDDFGTGYSSLTYLKRIPINTLKIDRSFTQDVATDPSVAAITSAVIELGHKLGIKVIAEGVEDAQQLAVMQRQGCDAMQGYYFSKPLSVEEFEALLKEGRRLPGTLPAVRSSAQ